MTKVNAIILAVIALISVPIRTHCDQLQEKVSANATINMPATVSETIKNGVSSISDVRYEVDTTLSITNISLYKPGLRVMESDQDSNILWATYDENSAGTLGKYLYASYDNGITWHLLHKFDRSIQTIRLTPLKLLLVSVATDRFASDSDALIYRSEDLGKTFEPALELHSGAATIWNIDADKEGNLYISEYGYKLPLNNSRRIYRSKNNGIDWEVIYQPIEAPNYHNHKLLVDKTNPNVIYQSIGDFPNNRLMYSSNRGETWNVAVEGFNPISAVQFDDHIVWGADTHPRNGIYIMDKQYRIQQTLVLKDQYGGSCYDMIQAGNRIYAGFTSYAWETQTWNGSIWYSDDEGYTWEKYAEIKKEGGIGIGLYEFTYLNNALYVRASFPVKEKGGNEYKNYSGTLRIDLRDEIGK